MNPRHPLVAARAGGRCEYCRAPEIVFNFPLEVEHILPRSRGGGDDETNWALACRSCNLRKSDHLDGIDPIGPTPCRLFHPRADRWSDHFRAEPETGQILGLTEVGRATVARLEMNSAAQREARRQWTRLGIFP